MSSEEGVAGGGAGAPPPSPREAVGGGAEARRAQGSGGHAPQNISGILVLDRLRIVLPGLLSPGRLASGPALLGVSSAGRLASTALATGAPAWSMVTTELDLDTLQAVEPPLGFGRDCERRALEAAGPGPGVRTL